MKIRDIATMKLVTVEPSTLVVSIAETMKRADVGFVPVLEDGKPVGVITDRDIVLRAMSTSTDPRDLRAQDIMTSRVHCVRDSEGAEDAAWLMVNNGVRRLVVINQFGFPVGVVSLDDLAMFTDGNETAGRVLSTLTRQRIPQLAFTPT